MRRLPLLSTQPLVAALALVPLAAHAQQADTHAIVGARVITVSGPAYERATIVMRDGLITAVGPDVVPPPGARVIDGKGLVVTPGLIDGLSAVGLPARAGGGPGTGGGGGAAGAGASAAPAPLAPQALALDRVRVADLAKARDAGVTTVLVIAKEGVLPGQSTILNLAGDKPEAMVLRQPAALHLHMATAARQYPGSLMGTMAYARQALADAGRARDAWAAWERAPRGQKRPRYDASLAPWQQALAGRLPLVVTCNLENDVRRALSLADEFPGLKLVLAGVPQGYRTAELLKARRLPLLVSVNFDPPRAGGGGFFGGFDEQAERRKIQDAERNPAELAKAGVPFALASAWAPDFVAGIRKAVEKGLASDAALRAATLGAAEALALAETTGSLEPGKLANVVAWSGEPFAKDTKARYVFVDGRLHEIDADGRGGAGRRAGGALTPNAAATATTPAGAAGTAPTAAAATGGGEAAKADKAEDKPLPPLPVSPPPFPAGRTIAITGGTLLTVGPLGDVAKGTLLIRDGRITAVGRDVTVPEGAVVIDASGRYVMPGIIDSHSHTALEGGVNECTDVITAETRVRDVIDHRDVSIYRQLAGGVTAINVLHGSCNAIGGQNAVLKLRWGKTPEELVFKEAPRGIKFALGENVKRSNFRAPGEARYPGSRMGVEVVLREGFLKARAYRKEWAEYEAKLKGLPAKAERPVPPRRDLRLETLADILDGKILVHAHGYRADEMLMLLGVADEFGFKVRTFQHGLEAYKLASEIATHGAGVGTFIDWWAYKMEALSAIPYNPTILAAKGVKVSLNSDSDELARRLYWDAAKAVKYGVSEAEALRMITLNPAWQLGVERHVGSLEVGKQADVAVFSAHPLAAGARCELTLVDGQVYFDRAADLQARRATAEWAPLVAERGPAPASGSAPSGDSAPREAETAGGSVAIRGARIVTVSGPVIERGTVLVQNGRIAAVGPDVAVPAGTAVIDASGKTLYPGLVDALTSLGLAEVSSVAATVDTTEVGDLNPHARSWVALHPDSELVPVARAGGVTTVLSAPAGGLVSGQSALVRLSGTTPASMVVKAPAALHVVYPSGRPAFDPARLFEEPEPKTLAERLEEQQKNQKKALDRLAGLLAEARAHAAAGADATRTAPETSMALEALAPFARGEAPVVVRANDEDDIRKTVAFAAEHGLRLVIAGGLEAWRCAELLKQKDVAVLVKVLRLPARDSDPYDAAYANAAALHRAGVRFAIVSDDHEHVRNLPVEAATAVAYGLPAEAALRAITLAPAEILGAADRVGQIAPGRDANLVLASGDILDVRTRVTDVLIDGVPQSLETRHTRLYERYKERP